MNTFARYFINESKNNKYRFDRIPRGSQSVYDGEGGALLKEATTVAERSHEAIYADQEEWTEIKDPARRRAARNKYSNKVRPHEEVELYKWANSKGHLLSNEEFTEQWIRDGKKGEGENEVYFDEDEQAWYKRNDLGYHSTYLEFFHRMAMHNHLFPDTAVTLIGFVVAKSLTDGHVQLQPVFKQGDVVADRGATPSEVKKHMKVLGYTKITGAEHDYINDEAGIVVEDLHDENVLVAPDGDLYIVDPVVYLTDDGKRHRLEAYSELDGTML